MIVLVMISPSLTMVHLMVGLMRFSTGFFNTKCTKTCVLSSILGRHPHPLIHASEGEGGDVLMMMMVMVMVKDE